MGEKKIVDFNEEYLRGIVDDIVAKNKWEILSVPSSSVMDKVHFVSLSKDGKLTPMVGFESVFSVICENSGGKSILFFIADGDKPIIVEKESKNVHKTGR